MSGMSLSTKKEQQQRNHALVSSSSCDRRLLFFLCREIITQQAAACVSPCARAPTEIKCSFCLFRMILANHFQRDTMAHPLLSFSFFFSPRDVANAIGTRPWRRVSCWRQCRPLNKLSLIFIPAVVIFFHVSHTKRCRSDSSSIAAFFGMWNGVEVIKERRRVSSLLGQFSPKTKTDIIGEKKGWKHWFNWSRVVCSLLVG